MLEKIESITETSFKIKPDDYETYDGYIIKTNKQDIKFGISNEQSCCEDWGYLTTNDDVEDFVGATITNITTTDTCLNEQIFKRKVGYNYIVENACTMFVNIHTDRGVLQLVAYNEHNGYYGHTVSISSTQLTESEII